MTTVSTGCYLHRLVVPDLPAPAELLPYLRKCMKAVGIRISPQIKSVRGFGHALIFCFAAASPKGN